MRLFLKNIALAGLILLGTAGIVYPQTDLSGELGLDLEGYRFSNTLKATDHKHLIDRKLSNHFLRLNITGPLVNDVFANYTASAKVYGTYYRVTTGTESASHYLSPDLGAFSAALSFLPQKPYPLQIYLNEASEYAIRYEASNKSISGLASPELAIVRRYFSETSTKGAIWKLGLSENLNADIEIRQSGMKVDRLYDFDENRDIWVVFTNLTINPLAEIDTIQIINSLPDDSLIVYVDLMLIDALNPGETVSVEVDSGYHDIEIVPYKYNSFRQNVRVDGNMAWEVVHTPPPTPNDLDQDIKAASATVRIGNNGAFTNETFFEYSATKENVQGMDINLGNFQNNAKYAINDNVNIQTMTIFNSNKTIIDTISSQTSNSMMHQTILNYSLPRGIITSASHSYNDMSTKTKYNDLNNKSNLISHRIYMPFKKLNYELDIKNSATLIKDNTGYANNQYVTSISNAIALDMLGFLLAPKNEFKYGYASQKNPDQSGTSLEDKFIVTGDARGLRHLAILKFKGEVGWRTRGSASARDSRTRYALDLSINRQIIKGLKLGFITSQEKETYGGSSPAPGPNRDQKSPAREDQGMSSYKFDAQIDPHKDFSLSGSLGLISQNSSKIRSYSMSLIFNVPKLNIPVKSFAIKQSRGLEGLPEQTQFIWETKASYRFRKVVLTVSHSLIEENLLNERYNFQEIRAEISRQFGIF